MLEKNFRTLEAFHGACVLRSSQQVIGFTDLNPYLPKQAEIEWQIAHLRWTERCYGF